MVFGFFIITYRGCIQRWMSSHNGFPAVLVRMLFCFTETWVKPDNLPITIPGFRILLSPFSYSSSWRMSLSWLPRWVMYLCA